MRFRIPRLRRRGDTQVFVIPPPPRDVVARLHGGPYDGYAVPMCDWPGPSDTVVIEDDVDPSQPDARYLPRAEQPADRRYRDMDYTEPGPSEEIGD
jgi:hypothetical protein